MRQALKKGGNVMYVDASATLCGECHVGGLDRGVYQRLRMYGASGFCSGG